MQINLTVAIFSILFKEGESIYFLKTFDEFIEMI